MYHGVWRLVANTAGKRCANWKEILTRLIGRHTTEGQCMSGRDARLVV